ncbi:MAG: cardiolipin synthase [Phycisphaerae bacterium]|nr:cardiolipin synthase [Phycisphaerae bacterium]
MTLLAPESPAAWLLTALALLDVAIRLILALRVLMRPIPVPETLAWLLLLLILPIGSTAIYLLIGEIRLGSRRAARSASIARDAESRTVALWRHRHQDWEARDSAWPSIANLCTAVSALPPLRGNRLELLSNSAAVLDRLVADIDAATRHVHLLYFIWMVAGRGDDVARALTRAAQRGVDCRVLVDAVGSRPFLRSPLAQSLRAAGVQVVASLPVNPLRLLLARIDLRNHRKIAVIDGAIAYTGSQNLTDDTFKVRRKGLGSQVGPWLDATLRIRGPAVHALELVFLRDWLLDADTPTPPLDSFLPDDLQADPDASVVHVVPSGPGPHPDAIHQAILQTLYSAREEIILTTPYFVPDEATKHALRAAAMRGVAVTLLLPRNNDSILVSRASKSHYAALLNAGVRILHHHPGLLHAKTITIDRRLALLGSANLDTRSFYLNFETTLWIYDDEFASVVRFMQTGYMAHADAVEPHEWAARSAMQRFLDNAAQLVGPLL